MSDLQDILEGEDQSVEAVEAPQQPEATQEAVTPAEQPEVEPKGDESAPPAQVNDDVAGLKSATAAERKKRQEAEARYDELKREIEALKAPKEPPAPPPSLWEDEQGWEQHLSNQVTQTAVQEATMNARLDMSEMMARQSNDDFETLRPEILKLMGENPAAYQQVMQDPHPWQKAYTMVKNQRAMSELGATNIDELKAQLLEQIKAEQVAAAAPAQPSIPQSLADAQSARGSGQSAEATALSLEDILKG